MQLSQVHLGQVVQITRIGGEGSFRRRLLELGLVPGTRVELVRVAPLGDPIELLVRGASLSIRKAEAGAIEVQATDSTQTSVSPTPTTALEPGLGL